tara:strand:+ start:1664 stop:3319 length:1656 start_codon:yes stop_codon:yes gene_type:complete
MNINKTKIAYFSAEIGISSSLPTYSGGLGVLAGDHIKASADIELPMVAVTLLYKEGYFKQEIDSRGKQRESYPNFKYQDKLRLLPNKILVNLRGRDVLVRCHEYLHKGLTGHVVPIYFLDVDFDDNHKEDRNITQRLYSGDNSHRILQEAILGIGGTMLLENIGYDNINTFHMNEGHCSFLTLELLKRFNNDHEKVKSMCHFTTHTPVEAGHDQFSISRCREILDDILPYELDLPSWKEKDRLHMTELGLYYSRSANGVSSLHGDIAQNQFPDFTISHITNGVYHPHWISKPFRRLFDDKVPNWKVDPSLLLNMDLFADDELYQTHQEQKESLIDYANLKTDRDLSSDMLTIGFARRAAEYKRARLIFLDLDRLLEIAKGKIQIIFAGKAHPNDENGKQIIEDIVSSSTKLIGAIEVVYLENYEMKLGQLITSGVDVWLNTPLRPNEASGTSGMKAALNGIPNLSILDGWWAEGCVHEENGWAIGESESKSDEDDADSLYHLLEHSVIPTFYNDKEKWSNIIRSSIHKGVEYTAYRMIQEYCNKFYSINGS